MFKIRCTECDAIIDIDNPNNKSTRLLVEDESIMDKLSIAGLAFGHSYCACPLLEGTPFILCEPCTFEYID